MRFKKTYFFFRSTIPLFLVILGFLLLQISYALASSDELQESKRKNDLIVQRIKTLTNNFKAKLHPYTSQEQISVNNKRTAVSQKGFNRKLNREVQQKIVNINRSHDKFKRNNLQLRNTQTRLEALRLKSDNDMLRQDQKLKDLKRKNEQIAKSARLKH